MKTLKEHAGSLVVAVLELLVGILLLIKPVGFTAGILIATGWLLGLSGIYCIVKYVRADAFSAAQEHSLALGLLLIALGGFCIFQSDWLIAMFPMLTVLYGAGILIIGFFKVQFTIDMLRINRHGWGWAALSAMATVIFAMMVLMNPFSSTVALWTFTAVSLIVEAVLDIAYVIMSIRKQNQGNRIRSE